VNSTLKSILFWVSLIVVLALIYQFTSSFQGAGDKLKFSAFLELVRTSPGSIESVTLTGNEITGIYAARGENNTIKRFSTYVPTQYTGLVNQLEGAQIEVDARPETSGAWATILVSWAPILLMIGFWVFIVRQMQSGGNKALSFGKSRAKLSSSSQKKVTFRDVA
jgi:cell division protease FtsH